MKISWKAGLIGMALLFGFVCILPNVMQRLDTTYQFQGIEALGADQEHFYAARLREVKDGNWGLGDPYHSEKDLPYLQPPLPEWVMGSIAFAFTDSIGIAVLIIKFLFGGLLFLSMSLFWIRLTDRPWISLLGTSAVLFSWFLFASPSALIDALSGQSLGIDYARFSRLTNPQFSSMLFFIGLYYGVDWFRMNTKRSIILAAVITGISFYAYPYTWSYLLVVFGLMFLWSLFVKEWERVKDLVLYGIVAAVIGIPFVLHTLHVVEHPAYESLSERFGLIASRAPVFGTWALLLVFLSLFLGKRISRAPRFLIIIAIGAFIVLNQQILTGSVVVPHHYHWYFIHPLAASAFVIALCVVFSQRIRKFKIAMTLLLLASVFWGVRYQVHAYTAQRELWGEMQNVRGAFDFVSERPTDIVYGDDLIGSLVPVFTPNDVSFAGAANVGCLCSPDLIRDSYFLELWLKGVTTKEVAETFPTSNRGSVSAKLYGLYYRELLGSYDSITDERVTAAIDAYAEFAALSSREKLKRAPTDLVIWNKNDEIHAQARSVLNLGQKVYEDEYYEVWDITPDIE